MSSNLSQNRISKHDQSEITFTPLNDDKVLESVKHLRELFSSCFGPNGFIKNIHNNSGGHVTVTSISSRLLQNISLSQPVLHLIVTSLDSHIKNYMDSGLFTGLLCLLLVEEFLKKDLHKHLIMDTLKLFLDTIVIHMGSNNSSKFKLNICHTNDLLKLIKSAISSKPACAFSEIDVDVISRIILETFLNSDCTTENSSSKKMHFVLLEGYRIDESHIVDGLLYEMPQIPTYKKSAIKCKMVRDEENDEEFIKVMIVDVSMAGDFNNFIDTVYEIGDFTEISDVVFDQLMDLAKYVVNNSIGVLACQKVVHPRIKKYLSERNVFVVERLGSQFIKPFSDLTGSVCYSSLNIPANEKHLGRLKSIRYCVYKNRSFVQFESKNGINLCTVVLCNGNEEALQELKAVFESALHILYLSMREPWCLYGAGCWQASIAGFLTAKISTCASIWAKELGASELQIREICSTFIAVLYKTVIALDTENDHMTDNRYNHHWSIPCGQTVKNFIEEKPRCACKRIQYHEGMEYEFIGKEKFNDKNCTKVLSDLYLEEIESAEIFDCFQTSMHGLQTAVSTACMVLGVANIVREK